MRVAVVTSTGNLGGAERIDVAAFEGLRDLGHELHVATPAPGSLAPELERRGIRCQVVASPPVLDGLSRRYQSASTRPLTMARATLTYQLRLRRFLRRGHFDAVLATGFRAQLAVTPIARSLRLPIAWVVADFIPVGPPASRLWSLLARRSIARALTYSAAAAGQPALEGAPTTWVHPGTDITAFRAEAVGPRPERLVLIGHLTPLKNHLGFVRVLERLRADDDGVTGLLLGGEIYRTAGHDEYAESVRSAVAALPAGTLELREATQAEIAQELRASAILLQMSTAPETFGMVCVEAMAAGCVVVGYDHGAVPEVVGPAGVVVPLGDEEELARTCAALLGDEERRRSLSAAAVERAGRFDLPRWRTASSAALAEALAGR